MKNQNDSIVFHIHEFEVKLDLIPIDKLIPHEEIDENHLIEMLNEIKNKGYLKDPLIVDSETFIVLDGTHRLAALKHLACELVPSTLVKYLEEKIKVSKWIRKVSIQHETIDASEIIKVISKYINNETMVIAKIKRPSMDFAKIADILDNNLFILTGDNLIFIENIDLNKNISIVKALDKTFKNIRYITLEELEHGIDQNILYYSGRKITKKEVIDYAKSGKLFPIKTTRHILPYRITDLKIPISFLSNIERAKQYLIEWMKDKQSNIKLNLSN